jgi:hypothetical protein
MRDCLMYMRWSSETDAIFPFCRAFVRMFVIIHSSMTFLCVNGIATLCRPAFRPKLKRDPVQP